MARKTVDHQHEKNMLRLWMPAVWTASLGSLMLAAGAILGDYITGFLTYSYIVGAAVLMLTIPVSASCIARTIEYDRLRSELLRSSACVITSTRISKHINKFYATYTRQLVCALALSTLEYGVSVQDSLVLVQQTHANRRKRLVPPKLLSKDWWLAHFTPVEL